MQDTEPIQPRISWYQKLLSSWLITEFLTINKLAWPCAVTSFGSNMLPFISLLFAGHIGKGLNLDGAALAISFSNITSKSLIIGFSTGMDTLCSQAYGAKNYRLVGLYFQRALLIGLLLCLPIIALCLNAEPILILIHQDSEVAAVAGMYLKILCVANPAITIYFISRKFLQTQRIVYPLIVLNVIGNIVNIISHYLFIVQFKFGVEGSAISLAIGYWTMALLYMGYIRCTSLYRSSWQGWRVDSMNGWLHYCKYGITGLLMLCLEWWTFEIGLLIVGATSADPKVQVGIFSVMLNVGIQMFTIPIGFGIATTVRVGNLLGENNPSLARKVSYLSLGIIFVIGIMFSTIVFGLRSEIAQLFTTDECIIAGATRTLFITAIYQNFDGLKLMGGSIIKGCGRQKIGSITNLIVYEFFAIPLSTCLCVVAKLEAMGYWIGMGCAIIVQALTFIVIVVCTNWRQVANRAQENAEVKSIGREQNIVQETESTSLLPSNTKVRVTVKECPISLGNVMKIITIVTFTAFFALGFGVSFYKYDHLTQKDVLISDYNSTLNHTKILCQY